MGRPVTAVLLAIAAASSACGATVQPTAERKAAAQAEGTTIGGYGMSIELPSGWAGRIFKRDERSAAVLRAANFPVYFGTPSMLGSAAAEIPSDGILIEAQDLQLRVPNPSREGWVRVTEPVEIRHSDFGRFKGIVTPAYALRPVVVNGRSIVLGVGFGRADPSDALLAEANRVLAGLHIDRDGARWGGEDASDPLARVFFDLPSGWFTGETSIGVPRAWPIPVAWAGNVPFVDDPTERSFPNATVRKLPPDGIVIELTGPRPYAGDADLPRLSLPLELSDGHFLADEYEGQPAPNVSTYVIDGWIDGEVVNVLVWLGRNAPTPALIAQANDALATLSISR